MVLFERPKCATCRGANPNDGKRFCSVACMLAHPDYSWAPPMQQALETTPPFPAVACCLVTHGPETHVLCYNVTDGVLLTWFAGRTALPAHLADARMLIARSPADVAHAVRVSPSFGTTDGAPIPPLTEMPAMLAENLALRVVPDPLSATLVPLAPGPEPAPPAQ